MSNSLTKQDVLRAVVSACSPDSCYINDEIQKVHRRQGVGRPPRTSLVLSRLNQLAGEGMLEKSKYTNGYYGYRWTITETGRAALSE